MLTLQKSSILADPYSDSTSAQSIDELFNILIDNSVISDVPSVSDSFPILNTLISGNVQTTRDISAAITKGRPRKGLSEVSQNVLHRRERNRLAAERCRQKKMETISILQLECESLRAEREALLAEIERLKSHK